MLLPLAARNPGLGPLAVGIVPSNVPEAVEWTQIVNATVDAPNTLRKTAGGSAWNAGACSTKAIPTGSDGYMEWTVGANYVLAGLSHGQTDSDYTDIDFGVYTYVALGQLLVYEAGVSKGVKDTYVPGDIVRVEVAAGVVVYRKNGSLIYTSPSSPSFPLLVDSSINNVGNVIAGATIYAADGLAASGY
jgi:hypothetical protein